MLGNKKQKRREEQKKPEKPSTTGPLKCDCAQTWVAETPLFFKPSLTTPRNVEKMTLEKKNLKILAGYELRA